MTPEERMSVIASCGIAPCESMPEFDDDNCESRECGGCGEEVCSYRIGASTVRYRAGYWHERCAIADTIERLQREVADAHKVALSAGNQSIDATAELYLARQQVAELRSVVQAALNVERQIGRRDSIVGPHDGMIERFECVLKSTGEQEPSRDE